MFIFLVTMNNQIFNQRNFIEIPLFGRIFRFISGYSVKQYCTVNLDRSGENRENF